jgi:DNA invertase Pin-like site-specific DNA recombinase
VAIYTRKSTSAGLEMEFNSLDAQYDACASYARSQPGWEVVAERYDDGGFTGANIERPAFQRLLRDIDAKRIDIVIVYKVDRLSRSLLDFTKVMDRFGQGDCAFVSVTQNFNTSDAMGRLTLNMLISFAEFEREMIAERTRDKIAGARRRGQWTGGRAPLGYRIEAGKLVVDEDEAEIVREIFREYIRQESVMGVVDLLASRGRTTKRHESKDGRVFSASAWSKDAVLRILKNDTYAGRVRAGDELVEGQHAGIIDRATFALVGKLMGGPRGGALPRTSEKYLLVGVVRCGACGLSMTPASAKTRGREYRYYRCISRDKRGTSACPTRPLPAAELERAVVDRVQRVAGDPKLVKDIVARTEQRLNVERRRLEKERASLPGIIAKLSSDAHRLADALVNAAPSGREAVTARMERITTQVRAHQERLAAVEANLAAHGKAKVDAEWVAKTLAGFERVWEAMTTTNRARLMRALVEKVVVDDHGGKLAVHLRDVGATLGQAAA